MKQRSVFNNNFAKQICAFEMAGRLLVRRTVDDRRGGGERITASLIREQSLFQTVIDPSLLMPFLPVQPYNVIVHAWFRNSINMILIQLTPTGNLYHSEATY